MGSEYPKGGGAIFLGHSPLWGGGGDIPRIFVPRWRYRGIPPKYEFAPQMPPQIPRPGAATAGQDARSGYVMTR